MFDLELDKRDEASVLRWTGRQSVARCTGRRTPEGRGGVDSISDDVEE